MVSSMGFRAWVSRRPAIQATGRLAIAPVGLPPTEHVCLRWTHTSRTIIELASHLSLDKDAPDRRRARHSDGVVSEYSAAPERAAWSRRRRPSSWRTFMRAHWGAIA